MACFLNMTKITGDIKCNDVQTKLMDLIIQSRELAIQAEVTLALNKLGFIFENQELLYKFVKENVIGINEKSLSFNAQIVSFYLKKDMILLYSYTEDLIPNISINFRTKT